jgi:hypothetical protein
MVFRAGSRDGPDLPHLNGARSGPDDTSGHRLLCTARVTLAPGLRRDNDRSPSQTILPGTIATFFEALERLDPRQQKANLQTILKAAYVFRDGNIALEFRECPTESNGFVGSQKGSQTTKMGHAKIEWNTGRITRSLGMLLELHRFPIAE